MFVRNTTHFQTSFLSFNSLLSPKQNKELLQSKEYNFYKLVFCKIDESIFKPLYSDVLSRPNAAVNCLMAALILKEFYDWSYEELMNNISYNLLTKTALGLGKIEEIPFCYATIFNFQNRLDAYQTEHDKDLFEEVFNKLTRDEISRLGIKTDIQRSDSTLIGANIQKFNRLQLIIEVLKRFYRHLTEEQKNQFKSLLSPYLENTSENYIYSLKSSDLPQQFTKIGQIYKQLLDQKCFDPKQQSYVNLKRVYQEHFIEVDNQLQCRENKDLKSSNLQSPDDVKATYRKKDDQQSIGRIINVFETCNPQNPLQLITDICVHPNNVDDSTILNQRIDTVKEKTPDLNELHTDGGYGSQPNDLKLADLTINHIPTAVRGRQTEIEIIIESVQNMDSTNNQEIETVVRPIQSQDMQHLTQEEKALETVQNQNIIIHAEITDTATKSQSIINAPQDVASDIGCNYRVSCPGQQVISNPTSKHNKAKFNTDICTSCTLKDSCPIFKKNGTYYFKEQDILTNKRKRAIFKIPPERRKLRPNVESTIYSFKRNRRNDKLKVRGTFKTKVYATCKAISTNFGRIYRYQLEEMSISSTFLAVFTFIATFFRRNLRKFNSTTKFFAKQLYKVCGHPKYNTSKNLIGCYRTKNRVFYYPF